VQQKFVFLLFPTGSWDTQEFNPYLELGYSLLYVVVGALTPQ